MALIECKECKHQVSSKADSCPHCGVKISSGMGLMSWILLIFGSIIVFSMLGKSPSKTPASTQTQTEQSVSNEPAAIEPQPVVHSWEYSELKDSMADGLVKTASIRSNNFTELRQPYSGGTFGTITIRKHPRWGTDVIFLINKGQLLCSYSDCKINVRFDDNKPKSYQANEPDDHNSETLFIRDHADFIKNIKKSKKVIIEATFYQNGAIGFEFNTENLNWK